MLQLIFGRAGSGKTEWLHQMLYGKARRGQGPLFLLVPEQYSFESERSLLQLLGPADARRVEVVSFTRLADTVMRAYGGLAGRRLDDCGRTVFMSLALEQCADKLSLYRRRGAEGDFVRLMLGTISEFKMGGISPEDTAKTAQSLPEGVLRRKLEELALVYGAYEALVAQSYADPLDDLRKLEELLRQHRFFAGATVAIDSFKGFTAQEMRVLELLLEQAQEVYAALCADELADPDHGMGLFSPVCRTAGKLVRAAKRRGVTAASPIMLAENHRFQNEALKQLEAGVFRARVEPVRQPPRGIYLYAAPHRYGEAEYAARTIRRLVRAEGYRYRDIAVIVRSEQDYAGIVDTTMRRYGIPCFMDAREPVDHKPLMCFALAALETVNTHFSSDPLFRYLKTGLAGLTTEEISLLENYAFLWEISGKRWLAPFTANPDGFIEGFTETQTEALARLNHMRERVTAPLAPLADMAQNHTGLAITRALFGVLEQTDAAAHLRESARQLEQAGLGPLGEEQVRLWDVLVNLLDQMAAVLGDHVIDLSRYTALLQLAIRSAEIAYIPQSLDEVLVGGADRTRPARPKAVFLLGANQGVFPRSPAPGGVFSEAERRRLCEAGMDLSDLAEERAVEELFLAYAAMTGPSERLYVTYARAGGAGEGMTPSRIVTELRRLFPALPEDEEPEVLSLEQLEAEPQAFGALAAGWNRRDELTSSLFAYFGEQPAYRPSLYALRDTAQRRPAQFSDPRSAVRLFGEKMALSPSRVEQYHQCPFQYFCRYGMNAKPRKPAKIDALEYGTLIHYLLENTLSAYPPESYGAVSRKEIQSLVKRLLEDYLQNKLGGWEDKTDRFRYLYQRFEGTAVTLVLRLLAELAQSAFAPEDFELEIGQDVQPITLTLPGGGEIQVVGKIDRVDVMRKNGRAFVRVVDYKTGAKQFKLSDLIYGVNMQMLIYLITLWKNGGGRYGPVLPAGVLYMPARSPKLEGVRGETAPETERRRMDGLKMNGLVLDDPEVIEGMEADVKGVFIPVKRKKDGGYDAASQLASLSQMGSIAHHIESMLRRMGESLQQGMIPASPLEDFCRYCDYASVCGRESSEPGQPVEQLKNQEVWDRLQAEEKEIER